MTDRTVLLRGGHVYTPTVPDATALLVVDETVAWVGRDAAIPAVEAAETYHLDGALVTPAFVDAHVHATHTGLALQGLDLSTAPSLVDALDRVAAHARQRPGATVLGSGWDETRWPERRAPTAAELDRAAGEVAVYLSRVDVHSAVVSSALLAATEGLPAMVGYDAGGHVRLSAHHAVRRAAYASVDGPARREAQRATRLRAAEVGIASLHEMGGPDIAGEDDFTGLIALACGEPGVGVVPYWGEMHAIEKARDLGAVAVGGDLFVDGSVGSHTAWLHEPYADADTCGHGWLTAEEITAHVVACAQARMQTGFHAIGDRALQTTVDGFAGAAEQIGTYAVGKGRHRVEHAELAPDAAAFARLGLVASVQPAFHAAWGGTDDMYAERLGVARAQQMNPYADLASAGVRLVFSSDAPVTPLDPWGAVRAAVHHRTAGQGIDLVSAFAAHTVAGWRAAHVDDNGVLVPGAPATYAIWDVPAIDRTTGLPDLLAGAPTCLRTAVRGHVVFDAVREGTTS